MLASSIFQREIQVKTPEEAARTICTSLISQKTLAQSEGASIARVCHCSSSQGCCPCSEQPQPLFPVQEHQELLPGRNQRRSSMNVPSLSLQLKCSATWDNCLLTLCLPALRQDLGMAPALLLRRRTEGRTCGCQQRSTEGN